MRALLLILFTVCALFSANVDRTFPLAEQPNWSVYDGDTATLSIDLGFNLTKRITLRVNGIDTPEIRPLKSRAAATVVKQYVQYWIAKHEGKISVHIIKYKGKYGRPIGDLVAGEERLSAYLIEQGLALKYDGGTKAGFTEAQLKVIAEKTVPKLEE